MFTDLPYSITEVDIGDWDGLPPEDLLLKPSLVQEQSPLTAAARALKYSRAGASDAYDEIGFRTLAAAYQKGPVPLQTIFGMRRARSRAEASERDPATEALLSEQSKLRHRPIELPTSEERFSYTVEPRLMHFVRAREGGSVRGEEEVWTFPLTSPPRVIMRMAAPRDEPPITAQFYDVEIPGANWVSLSVLIESGRFRRMQEWRERLETRTAPNRFYCFVSHRWLTPTHPDPEGVQAAFTAWQMFSHLCEAVRVAKARGLHEPRKFIPGVGFYVGIAGTTLAEALVVNLLRRVLDEELLERAWQEAAALEEFTEGYGVAAARNDTGLQLLRDLTAGLPVLSALLGLIFLWYDYGCMPQRPRTDEDEELFREALRYLVAMQVMGRTAILLDEAEDYLSRGWCSLEALVADTSGAFDLLVGSARRAASEGVVEHYFDTLMEDRPHILWRALLDAELFRVQTPEQCMSRLSLGVTESRDLPFIYKEFLTVGAPPKIHFDDSEIVTGVLPLPALDGGGVLMPRSSGRPVSAEGAPRVERTLDWTAALRLGTGWGEDDRADLVKPFMMRVVRQKGEPSCHVAVVAGCEGEAVLLGNWAWKRLGELEEVVGARVASLSWVATDIAPVGFFVDGSLRAVPVRADVWVVVALSSRLQACPLTGDILKTLDEAKVRHFELAFDLAKNNVREVNPRADGEPGRRGGQTFEELNLGGLTPPVHVGGLYRRNLLEHLL